MAILLNLVKKGRPRTNHTDGENCVVWYVKEACTRTTAQLSTEICTHHISNLTWAPSTSKSFLAKSIPVNTNIANII